MLDAKAANFQEPVMQRSSGAARVAFDGTRLRGLHQRGSAKAILPRVPAGPEVVFLNTSGGLTSGDTLEYSCDLRGGARLVATTQAAERAYRADEGRAEVQVRHRVGAGCWLDWLPQETILFDRAKLGRETVIELAPDAGCLMLEAVVLGRIAMGERVTDLQFFDMRRIERAGKPVFFEPFLLDSNILAQGARSGILGDARAMATLVLCTQDAQDAAVSARAVLNEPGVVGAVSGFDGKCVIRLLAREGWPLRRQILRLMECLRRGQAAPRVWQI
ncbi:MAG: urease accessory protein UreD [Rhodobacteraceae bacterium]|nr:urease accessory protein UreD [Paracoccaceae bacterium]